MYILKGFIAFPALTDNAIGEVAVIGELSKDSLTYARETGLYRRESLPDVALYSFQSADDVTGAQPVPDVHAIKALEVGTHLFSTANFGFLNNNSASALRELENGFRGTLEEFEVGDMVTNGSLWMPEWVSYRLTGEANYVRLWFVDTAFSAQYDGFEYDFIAPLANIDDFFRPRAQVQGLLNQHGFRYIIDRTNEVRDVYPYTVIDAQTYAWIDYNPQGEEIPTNWTVIVYGRAGHDPDQIRLALVDWILSNSTRNRDEWLARFPEIFTPTEFIVIPLWHQFAVPNQTIQAGLNSPVITLIDAQYIAQRLARGIGYEAPQLFANTVVATTPYRTLGSLISGSSANRNGITNFRRLYPDYVPMPVGSPDFARLSTRTQSWIKEFVGMLMAAEKTTAYSVVPPGYNRVIRDGIVYISKYVEGMTYLTVTRHSALELLDIEAPYEPEFPDDDCGCVHDGDDLRGHVELAQNPHGVTKAQVGLALAENRSYLTLPEVAIASQGLVSSLMDGADYSDPALAQHVLYSVNPHRVTKAQVGLGQVANVEAMTVTQAVTGSNGVITDLLN